MSQVFRHVLDNGLVVLLKPVRSAPIISWWVLYRIGSRNERTGITGASHWVEHMLFKGTDQFPAGTLDKAIDRLGGSWNAQTFLDYTAYYETLPADQVDLALRIEADRMSNAQFDPEEVASERTVIISERQGAENSPMFWLGEEVQAAAFRVHGYHHEIIGDMTDLHTMTRDDLYGHYKAHYMPNNAIAVAVGDFDPDEMLERIRTHYGSIPAGAAPTLFSRPEPPQQGERRVTVERPGTTGFIQIAYRVPAATEADWFKLDLLNSILCGPDGMGGGGIDNRTSRLYKALVETELTVSVDGGMTPTIDPFMYTITMALRDGVAHADAEAAFDAAIAQVIAEGITEREYARARKQARALFAYGTERVTMQAFWLAFAENFNSYIWFEDYVQKLEAVTIEDVKDAAQYLRPQNRTVGWFVPLEGDYDGDDRDHMEEGDE
ncbi:MAG: pitrilysin family protein [Chloroflexota bacterium]|nr:pitrilysin family protein [Chloroflexota bacterium]